MIKTLFNRFSDDRKFFAIVFFILLVIILLGVITPILIKRTQGNWEENITSKITGIENSSRDIFESRQSRLTGKSNFIVKGLVTLYGNSDSLQPRILYKILGSDFYNGYCVGIYNDSLKLISWTNNYNISNFANVYQSLKYGETFFYNYNISTYLAKADSIRIGSRLYYIMFAQLIEKHYKSDNKLLKKISFAETLANKFLTEFDIDYYPNFEGTKDGRKYSFFLYNDHNNKIGVVTFTKPSLNSALNSFSDKIDLIQSLLIAVAGIVISFGFRKDFISIRYRSVKLLVIGVYFIILRVLFFQVGFPSIILDGEIINPNNFSSAFGYGIVKSPIELFITSIFCLLFVIKAYQYYLSYFKQKKSVKIDAPYSYIFAVVALAAFLFIVRGFAATIKSVIFDSTLRYFKDPDLIPDFTALLMNLNTLMIGFVIIIVLLIILLVTVRMFYDKMLMPKKIFLKAAAVLLVANILFVALQENPLLNIYLIVFIVLVISTLLYHVYYIKNISIYNYVYIALTGSILSITLLNYFNSELERESLKTIALELNRPNENILRFYVEKTLTETVNNKFLINSFLDENETMSAAAFNIWSKSPLQKESADFYVFVLDKNKAVTGYFSKSLKTRSQIDPIIYSFMGEKVRIFESELPDGMKIISGIIPVTFENETLGYVAVSVKYSGIKIHSEVIPDFLISSKNIFNDVLNTNELNIFSFENKKLIDSYGNLYLSKNQTEQLINADFSELNERWVKMVVTGENYLFYVLKVPNTDNEKYTVVALREKQISLNLYNFFRLFLIHSIFILLLIAVLFLLQIKRPFEFKLRFRTQLLSAFLFMSLMPILSLAVYNRHVVSEKSRNGILNELKEKAEYVENSIERNKNLEDEDTLKTNRAEKNNTPDVRSLFSKVSREQNINFSVFKDEKEVFSSVEELSEIGIMPEILNSRIYNRLNNSGFKEYSNEEELDYCKYISFYKKIQVRDEEYVINVNSAVNKINISITSLDIDIFLFGIYAFASIIIIIIGTILANKISSPIRKLTKATSAVAHGDFNFEVPHEEKGEVQELINGFNIMTKELVKRQTEIAELERETAWKEMARQVAHEIKNPLTPMKLAVQQLIIASKDKHPAFDSIFEKVTATLLNQIDTLNTIASEFSNFARMPNYNLETVDIIPIIKDTINLFLDEKIEIQFSSEISSGIIEGDTSQIRRIIINLFRNSIQAGAAKIKISAAELEDFYIVNVSDNGTGIPEELHGKIFDQNFTTKDKGMGLGLKLASKFMESIGGKIYLKTSSSSGSEFTMQFIKKKIL